MRKVLVLLLFFLINLALYSTYLLHFVINGDDLNLILDSPTNLNAFLNQLINFSGQYRPLSHLIFNIYKPLGANFPVIYFTHLLFFSIVQTLFYYLIKNKNSILEFVFTALIFINPIFYYHIFTLASDINLGILIIILTMLLSIRYQKYFLLLPLFITSILMKETFLVTLPIIFSRKKYPLTAITSLIFISYLIIHFAVYKPTDSDYSFVFTIDKAKENILNLSAWVIGHPRGWQYNFYGFRNPLNYLLDVLYSTLWIISLIDFYKNPKKYLYIFLALLLSIAPFIFLNRILPYYLDITVLLLAIPLSQNLSSKLGKVILSITFLTALLSTLLFLDKWVNNSFVGVSNKTAQDFLTTIKESHITPNQNLCIINHTTGTWPTYNGKLIYYYLPNYKGKIISISENTINNCLPGIIIKNEEIKYSVLRN